MQRRALTLLLLAAASAAVAADHGDLLDLPGVAEAAHEAAARACAGDSAGHPACAGLVESRRQLSGAAADDESSVLNIVSTNQGEAAINFATVRGPPPLHAPPGKCG